MKDQNLERTDYDVNAAEEDPRFVRSKKEFTVVQAITLFQIFVLAIIAYAITGSGAYILGYPAWYAAGTLFCLCIAALSIIYAMKFIRRSKLDAIADDEEEVEG